MVFLQIDLTFSFQVSCQNGHNLTRSSYFDSSIHDKKRKHSRQNTSYNNSKKKSFEKKNSIAFLFDNDSRSKLKLSMTFPSRLKK